MIVFNLIVAIFAFLCVVRAITHIRENEYPRTSTVDAPFQDVLAMVFFLIVLWLAIDAFKEALHS